MKQEEFISKMKVLYYDRLIPVLEEMEGLSQYYKEHGGQAIPWYRLQHGIFDEIMRRVTMSGAQIWDVVSGMSKWKSMGSKERTQIDKAKKYLGFQSHENNNSSRREKKNDATNERTRNAFKEVSL
jgi:hypothetical protein